MGLLTEQGREVPFAAAAEHGSLMLVSQEPREVTLGDGGKAGRELSTAPVICYLLPPCLAPSLLLRRHPDTAQRVWLTVPGYSHHSRKSEARAWSQTRGAEEMNVPTLPAGSLAFFILV